MTQHTQGPWTWHNAKNDDGTHNGSVIYEKRPGMAYCVCKAPRYQTDDQWEADAALIAAAPDLLSALNEMLITFQANEEYDDESRDSCELARKAIAKATLTS